MGLPLSPEQVAHGINPDQLHQMMIDGPQIRLVRGAKAAQTDVMMSPDSEVVPP